MVFGKLLKIEEFKQLSGKELDHLDRKKNAQQKIIALINLLQLTHQDINDRTEICQKIQYCLSQFYPHCELFIFGSSVNGFGFKGCDLDLLFVPFPGYCNVDFQGQENESVPNPHRLLKGLQSTEDLLHISETSHLKFVRKVLYMKRLCEQITFIPAKCPILFLKIQDCDFEIDLSASNRLVLRNTELLLFFCDLDSRVRQLVMLLRYWAKSLGFISKSCLSSYSLSLLVIFALQNTEPAVLPSVKSLIETAGYSHIIDGWETAYNKNIGFMPKFNLDSIERLLEHFFTFYWNFDFCSNVVSPYHGKPLPIKYLKDSEDERLRNFPVNAFSIQDPFILKNNLSRNPSIVTLFKLSLLIAKELISMDSNFSMQQFLNSAYYQKHLDSIYEPTLCLFHENSVISTIRPTYEIISKLGITNDFRPWFENVLRTILDALNYGLLIECEVVDKIIWNDETDQPVKKRKVCILDSLKNLELLMTIQCTVYFNTWVSRNAQVPAVDLNDIDLDIPDNLKKEYSISKRYFPESPVITESPLLWFLCDCYKYPVDQLNDIILIFSPLTPSPNFDKLASFLRTYVNNKVQLLLGV